jgi:hypothetical protein
MQNSPIAVKAAAVSEPFLRVECYAGYKGDQYPLRVFFRGRLAEVTAVEDRWYSPGSLYFRVLMNTGERYVLRHEEAQDQWTLEAFRAANSCFDTKVNGGV